MLDKTKFHDLVDSMGRHSISSLPLEACGIITKQFEYFPCDNISPNPKTNFIVNPLDIIEHSDNIWGFFHSHPNSSDPVPSPSDVQSTVFREFKFIVGFSDKFYIYWTENTDLKFEVFNESHCTL